MLITIESGEERKIEDVLLVVCSTIVSSNHMDFLDSFNFFDSLEIIEPIRFYPTNVLEHEQRCR